MELLIFAACLLIGSFGFVVWLRLDNDARERDEWERFQRAMESAQNPKEN